MMCFLRLPGRDGELALLRKLAPLAATLGEPRGEAPSTVAGPAAAAEALLLSATAAVSGSRPAEAGADLLPDPMRLSLRLLLKDPPEGARPPEDVFSGGGGVLAVLLAAAAAAAVGLLPGAGMGLLPSRQTVNGHNRQLLLACDTHKHHSGRRE